MNHGVFLLLEKLFAGTSVKVELCFWFYFEGYRV